MQQETLQKLKTFERNGWKPTKAVTFIETLISFGVPLGAIMTTDVQHSTLKVYVTIPYGYRPITQREKVYRRFSNRDALNAATWYAQNTTTKGN